MAEVFVQCGHFIMVPNQLARLDYDSGNRIIEKILKFFI